MCRMVNVCSAGAGVSGFAGSTGPGPRTTSSKLFGSMEAIVGDMARKESSNCAVTLPAEVHLANLLFRELIALKTQRKLEINWLKG
jgi:hypothetical protein